MSIDSAYRYLLGIDVCSKNARNIFPGTYVWLIYN
uniref:Predicted protein n=1 Tax=Hordeum vulgare subsp. vulgare TaxID=112509 RepID=F2E0F6_HORVV|nr:predicted protein [Hordeum vulgare subsp. vulgare]